MKPRIDLEQFLYDKVMEVMDTWEYTEDMYVVSFMLYQNDCFTYEDLENLTDFSVGYNTEEWTDGAGPYDEARWNYAFWCENEVPIIDVSNEKGIVNENFFVLMDWYMQENIEPFVYERGASNTNGYMELLKVVTKVAKRIQEEGYLKEKLGKRIPIVIHDLDYVDEIIEATKEANPYGEANDFLQFAK